MCLGVPGQIVEIINAEQKLAKVDVAGVRRAVNIACVVDETHKPEYYLGQWVLVHVGFAMSRIDEREAQRTLQLLRELGDVQDELRAMQEA